MKKERVLLRQVLDAAVESVQPVIGTKNHRLKFDLLTSSPMLEVDSVRLTQVVSNLLTNAAKYTDPAGEITLGARLEPDALILFVRDNGIGLAPEMVDRIFEMFVQVAPSKDRTEGGLGIGLALVKALVELHGGKIEACSAGHEQGSTFTVKLPRSIIIEGPAPSIPFEDAISTSPLRGC